MCDEAPLSKIANQYLGCKTCWPYLECRSSTTLSHEHVSDLLSKLYHELARRIKQVKVDVFYTSSANSDLKDFNDVPNSRPPGHRLPRTLWTQPNRVRTCQRRLKHNMFEMGRRASPTCKCGAAKQATHHIRATRPINRAPNNLSSENLDDAALHWLE